MSNRRARQRLVKRVACMQEKGTLTSEILRDSLEKAEVKGGKGKLMNQLLQMGIIDEFDKIILERNSYNGARYSDLTPYNAINIKSQNDYLMSKSTPNASNFKNGRVEVYQGGATNPR